MTDFEDFALLGKNMRHAQKEYFRTRDAFWLTQAKDLERRFDRALVNTGLILNEEDI